MLQDSQSWRDLLGKLIKDPQERQRIANQLGVNPLTLLRWVSGESKPRLHNLRLLLTALPEYRASLLQLFPAEFGTELSDTIDQETQPHEIPSIFYSQVVHAHCMLPTILHFSSLCDIILQQALEQLDPNRVGIMIAILQCLPPAAGSCVRSLWVRTSRCTDSWQKQNKTCLLLVGSESAEGHVVKNGVPYTIQKHAAPPAPFLHYWQQGEECAQAYPIMQANTVAGCMVLASTQPDYFLLPARQILIRQYAQLFALVFGPDAFYPFERIALERIPRYEDQVPYTESIRHRIADAMSRYHLNFLLAERLVLQKIEAEFLQLTSRSPEVL